MCICFFFTDFTPNYVLSAPHTATPRMAMAVTPLMKKPYEEQLEDKRAGMEEFLKRATVPIRKKDAHPVSLQLPYSTAGFLQCSPVS